MQEIEGDYKVCDMRYEYVWYPLIKIIIHIMQKLKQSAEEEGEGLGCWAWV